MKICLRIIRNLYEINVMIVFQVSLNFDLVKEILKILKMSHLLGAAEIVECVCKYEDGITYNLQSLSPYYSGLPTLFSFLRSMVNKSNHRVIRYKRVSRC